MKVSEQNKETKLNIDKERDNEQKVPAEQETSVINTSDESEATEQVEGTVKDVVEETEPEGEAAEPESDAIEPVEEATEQVEETAKVTLEEPEKTEVTVGIEENDNKKETKSNTKKGSGGKKLSGKAKAGIAIAAAAVIGVCAFTLGGSAEDKNAKAIVKAVDKLQEVNPYIQMMVGQDKYIYLLYNEKGEAFAESSSGGSAFYRNDNQIISIGTEEVYVDYDLNPLSFIKAAAKVAADNTDTGCAIDVQEDTYTDDITGEEAVNKMYTVTVSGKDNISKIYGTLEDEEYVKQSIEMLYSGFEDVEQSQIDVIVSVGDTGRFGAICNVTYGDVTESAENIYTSWVFDGYIPTFDWSYPADLYKDKDSMTLEDWTNLAGDITADLSNKMNEFMKENNLLATEAQTDQITGTQFLEMKEEEQLETLNLVQSDLYNYGFYVSCEINDMLKDIKDYYADETNKETVGLFQATINVGVGKGWLNTIEVEGTQAEIEQTESTEVSTDAEGSEMVVTPENNKADGAESTESTESEATENE